MILLRKDVAPVSSWISKPVSRVDLSLDFAAAAALAFAMVSRSAADELGVCCSVGRVLFTLVGVDFRAGYLDLGGFVAIGGGEGILIEDLPVG